MTLDYLFIYANDAKGMSALLTLTPTNHTSRRQFGGVIEGRILLHLLFARPCRYNGFPTVPKGWQGERTGRCIA